MDTSREYVQMCEKATEIQALKPIYQTHGEWFVCAICNREYTEDSSSYFPLCDGHNAEVWLPRQDQLQEMIGAKTTSDLIIGFLLSCGGLGWDSDWHPDNHVDISSMEQLWLAFVMHQKYGKRWDGTDWVKES